MKEVSNRNILHVNGLLGEQKVDVIFANPHTTLEYVALFASGKRPLTEKDTV